MPLRINGTKILFLITNIIFIINPSKINFWVFYPMKVVHCVDGYIVRKHFHFIIFIWLLIIHQFGGYVCSK